MNTASLLISALWHGDGLPMARTKDGVGKGSRPAAGDTRCVADCPEIPEAFDRWLNEKLVLLYNPVLDEPIPEDLLKLIETHRRSSKSG